QRVDVQHVVGTSLLCEPSRERPGERPEFRVLPVKVEVANILVENRPVDRNGYLSPSICRRGGYIHIDAQSCESFRHALDGKTRASVERRHAGDYVENPHASIPFRSSHSSSTTSTHRRDHETDR